MVSIFLDSAALVIHLLLGALVFTCVFISRFYTLMVLSTALFNKPAFQNLICNGLVLAEDGKKMSKRLKNYPPPMDVVNEYGAVRTSSGPPTRG